MEQWKKLALLLCVFGILKELRPLEPFITQFLSTPPMNFTHDQINLEIYPVSIYANLIWLVIMFLVTDMLRYKPIIILNSLSGISVYLILLYFRSVLAIQVVEVLYGLFMACEVAYYTYIYAKVDKSHYQEVTGFTRAAYLTGRGLSGILAQIFLAFGLDLMISAYVTLGFLILALLWAISLPSVSYSIYFNRESANPDAFTSTQQEAPQNNKIKEGFKLLYEDFLDALTKTEIYKYVLWWAACNGGYLQVLQFVQVLWNEIITENPQGELLWNGAVEAICTFTGAIGACLFGKWKANWNLYGELALGFGAICLGLALIVMSITKNMIVAYITYITFSVFYNTFATIAKSQIASHIKPDSTGLIFGIAMFLALVLETVVTFVLVQYLQLHAKPQFFIYGSYYVVIGAIFGIKWLFTRTRAMVTPS